MPPPAPFRRAARGGVHQRVLRSAWLLALPGVLTTLALLWLGDYSTPVRVGATGLLLVVSGGGAYLLRERFHYSLRTLANVVAALRDGDFSIRLHPGNPRDPLALLAGEINALGDTLREQRLGALEASALLRTTIEELDAAIFTFDDRHRLRLANRAAERLLARPVEQLLGRTADELGLEPCLEGEPTRVASLTFPGAVGRFGVRRSGFRQGGRPHQLLVLADLSRALRDEERQAWQRLLRVLGHELNNSLAPIKSVAASLEAMCRRQPRLPDWEEDLRDGLSLISGRADALSRFMQAYAQLARLPAPRREPMALGDCLRRVASLEARVPVRLVPGPEISLLADRDQLEQLLINLIRNAADAVLEVAPSSANGAADGGLPEDGARAAGPVADPDASCAAPVEIEWSKAGADLEIRIADRGPGIANPANLFVPFFTTKPKGSGIGLTLCRQIAEAHGGRLTLEPNPVHRGCLARLRLPMDLPSDAAVGG